jgi:hypothetical protein
MWFLEYRRRRKIQLAAADEYRMCHDVLASVFLLSLKRRQ